jgi:hypothetical protein
MMHEYMGDALPIPLSYPPEETEENASQLVFPFSGGVLPNDSVPFPVTASPSSSAVYQLSLDPDASMD